jgi:hypothetical protein
MGKTKLVLVGVSSLVIHLLIFWAYSYVYAFSFLIGDAPNDPDWLFYLQVKAIFLALFSFLSFWSLTFSFLRKHQLSKVLLSSFAPLMLPLFQWGALFIGSLFDKSGDSLWGYYLIGANYIIPPLLVSYLNLKANRTSTKKTFQLAVLALLLFLLVGLSLWRHQFVYVLGLNF